MAEQLPQRKIIRMQSYDYSMRGRYFVTIVTHHRQCVLGSVHEGMMEKSSLGEFILDCFKGLADEEKGVMPEDICIMPNHIHFILTFTVDGGESLPAVIGRFKYRTQEKATAMQGEGFRLWQRSYYEHIIRTERADMYIRNYIYENPSRWAQDKLNANVSDTPDEVMANVLALE